MKKKVLILNGSFCEQPLIVKAKQMGYYVVTTGNMPELMGHAYADEYIPADYSDKETVLKLVKENGIEGIISCANDFGVLTAAYVAEQMGWKGHDSYETAELLHHKDKFKQYCYEKGIPSPRSLVFTEEQDLLAHARECEYPIIVKANDLTGGKGIMRADNFEEAKEAAKNAFAASRSRHIIVEPYLDGLQQAIDVFLVNGEIAASASNNSYSPINPYLIQYETFPASGFENVQEELFGIIRNMAKDLQLCDGILTFQFMLCNGKPYIIEAMRRCFGNQSLTSISNVSGYPWEEAYIRAALGLDCSMLEVTGPKYKCCGHFGVLARQNGVLKEWHMEECIKKSLYNVIEMIQPGGEIKNYMSERIAYLYFAYESIAEMNEALSHYNENIIIKMSTDGE